MRYTDSQHKTVRIDELDATVIYAEGNLYYDYIQERLDEGQIIEPYNPYHGLTLDEVKEQKRQEIKTKRNEIINGVTDITTSYGTYPVDVNQANRSNLHQVYDNAVLAGVDLTSQVAWKMGDNQFYLIRYDEMPEIGIGLSAYIQDQYAHEAVKIAEINACTDVDCITSVSW